MSSRVADGSETMFIFSKTRKATETRNEPTIATTSHQAFTRHQNQRTRCSAGARADLEDDVERILRRVEHEDEHGREQEQQDRGEAPHEHVVLLVASTLTNRR